MSTVTLFGSLMPDPAEVQQETWGHLAPEAERAYTGTVLFAASEWGETVLLASDFPGLPDSPWLFDDLNSLVDFVITRERLDAGIYLFTGTYIKPNDEPGTFDGAITVTSMTGEKL